MKNKILSKEWGKLIGEDLPKLKMPAGDINWVFDLLGWKKDARRT